MSTRGSTASTAATSSGILAATSVVKDRAERGAPNVYTAAAEDCGLAMALSCACSNCKTLWARASLEALDLLSCSLSAKTSRCRDSRALRSVRISFEIFDLPGVVVLELIWACLI